MAEPTGIESGVTEQGYLMFDRGKVPATGRGAACLSGVAALQGRVEWCNKGNCPAADILCTAGIICKFSQNNDL